MPNFENGWLVIISQIRARGDSTGILQRVIAEMIYKILGGPNPNMMKFADLKVFTH